jgi:putative PIN family toxin of toxin-antitoxin system
MLGATADTNVYISALNFGGRPLQFLELARRGQIRLCISEPILTELIGVLRDKFGWDEEHLRQAEQELRTFTEIVTPTRKLSVVSDEPDNRILECTAAARFDFVVSGDQHLLRLSSFEGIPIVTVTEFLRQAQGS